MEDKENQQGIQFQFRKRYRRVDWKLLASVDVDRIARELDYHALQANIMNIAFCDTRTQDFNEVDEDFLKLYRLGQYTIEYLLHCQEYLSHGTVELEGKLRDAIKFRNEVKEKLETKQKELIDVKKESRKRKKMIAVYQGMINTTGVNGFHKCTHCDKAFVSAPFLTSHLERRHGIVPPPSAQNIGSLDKLRIAHEELEGETETLKNKYQELEEQLKRAQESSEKALTLRDAALAQQLTLEESYTRWKKEESARHSHKLEQVKTVYLKEAADALEEKRIAQLALVEAKKGIVSNLGALRDEKHEHDDLRQEQITELQEQFEFKVSQLQQEMEQQSRKLRTSEELHRAALEDAKLREERLVKQLKDKTVAEQRLHDILYSVEVENAKLVQMNKENPDIRSTLSPNVLAQLTDGHGIDGGEKVEVIQKMLATQPVEILQKAERPQNEVVTEKRYSPFKDKPYIKTYYEHPSDAINASRKEMENDLAMRLLNLAATPGIESLGNEEYNQYKDRIDRDRISNNTSYQIQKLHGELNDICRRQGPGSPGDRGSGSPIPTNLPPKSPSFKQSRESLSRPNSSKRTKTTPPATSPILPRNVPRSRDPQSPSRDLQSPSRDLQSPSSPELIRTDKILASTPKIGARSASAEDIAKPSKFSHFDDEDSEESAQEDDELFDEEMPEEGKLAEREIRVADLESDISEVDDVSEIFDEQMTGNHGKTPGYSLRDPNYNPLDDESDEGTPSPIEPVKRRAHKTYSKDMEEADSIFSFEGWSKMKNRNSMSADDAQQNIPMGHVAKMRQAVDNLNKQKRGKQGLGISLMPDTCRVDGPATCPIDRDADEDEFTVSSLSERDLSPVGMTVDIKRNSRNVADDGR